MLGTSMLSGLEALQVLTVEDNVHMRAIVGALLQGLGLKDVRQARDGEQAVEILREHPIDIALVDFLMAPMDGVSFTRLIRTDETSPNIYLPIIMMTGHSQRSRVCEARDAGVTEFVTKPLTARALALRIGAVIHRPRPFVRTPSYFGPDRRRKDDSRFASMARRMGDVRPVEEAFALD